MRHPPATSHRRLAARQMELEDTPIAQHTLRLNRPPQHFSKASGDREAQACSSVGAGQPSVGLPERFKKVSHIFVINSHPRVPDLEQYLLAQVGNPEIDAPLLRKLHRVTGQV